MIEGAEAVVPAIWKLEVVNALVVAERRKKIAAEKTAQFIQNPGQFKIKVDLDGLEQISAQLSSTPGCTSAAPTTRHIWNSPSAVGFLSQRRTNLFARRQPHSAFHSFSPNPHAAFAVFVTLPFAAASASEA